MSAPAPNIESSSRAASPPSTAKLFRLMFWVHWRTFLAQLRGIRAKSPLLLAVLGAFILGYLIVGYWLFHEGLAFVYRFPLVGALLSQRVVFLIFTCFFVMLIFSNLVIGYSTLFKNRETAWLLTLPVRHRDVYRWKFIEGLAVSSWALIFLSAPLMLAYGRVHGVSPLFYIEIAAAYVPFVVIPALIGSWTILGFVHAITRSWGKWLLLLLGAVAMGWLLIEIKPIKETQAANAQEVLAFDKLLRNTRISQHPLMPSSWLAQIVLAASDELTRKGAFYFCVLLSNALMGMLIAFGFTDRFFYQSWSTALSSRAERFHRSAEQKRHRVVRRSLLEQMADCLPLSLAMRAMVLKDARVFWRDPAQWTQFMIFFGLLCLYILNLRNVAFESSTPFWETLISYLNLGSSALTLSTLTTRFVFPQFSLEGRRLWIVGLAPIGLNNVVMQKFWTSFVIASALTLPLMILSSAVLHLAWIKIVFFCTAIVMLSASLSGLAAGLGALFPNFKEDNPSKIVSGFGGTLCLVVSFIYITCFIALAAVPAVKQFTHLPIPIPDAVALIVAILISAAVLLVPMILAMRHLKKLEF